MGKTVGELFPCIGVVIEGEETREELELRVSQIDETEEAVMAEERM